MTSSYLSALIPYFLCKIFFLGESLKERSSPWFSTREAFFLSHCLHYPLGPHLCMNGFLWLQASYYSFPPESSIWLLSWQPSIHGYKMKLIFFSHPNHPNSSPPLMSLVSVKVITRHLLHWSQSWAVPSLLSISGQSPNPVLPFLKMFQRYLPLWIITIQKLSSLDWFALTATLLVSLPLLVLSRSCFWLIPISSEWCFWNANSIHSLDFQCLEDRVQTP